MPLAARDQQGNEHRRETAPRPDREIAPERDGRLGGQDAVEHIADRTAPSAPIRKVASAGRRNTFTPGR